MVEENIFEINQNVVVETQLLNNSEVYIIDDFYKHPEKVLNLFLSVPPKIHKKNEKLSYNQIYFDDRRHRLKSDKISHVYKFLGSLCNQKSVLGDDAVVTNFTRFKTSAFNDYKQNYWWPHIDEGYTGILYLSDDTESGTNLYNVLNYTKDFNTNEHYTPWRSKKDYQILMSLKSKFNRMVLFDGLKFCHAMNICNQKYFGGEYRINQVFFFSESK
jgi:hypothetical protein